MSRSGNDIVVVAGRADVSVTSTGEVDLLSTSADGVGLNGAVRWCLAVETSEAITLRVYKRAGSNCGFVLLSALTATVSANSQATIEYDAETAFSLRVTGQATGTTASVDCDLIGRL